MKILTRSCFFILFFSFSFLSLFAAEPPEEISVTKQSNTSVSLEWKESSDALGYYIYYDTASGENGIYRNEIPDLIEGNVYTMEGLKSSTQYYIALTSIDINGEESRFSQEIVATTTGSSLAGDFILENVEVTGIQEITLTFNSELDNTLDTERDFILLNSVTNQEVSIIFSQIDSQDASKLILSLETELELGGAYDFTILSILDKNGRSIESGIDAITNFEVPLSFDIPQEDIPSPEESVQEPEQIELNSAPEKEDTSEEIPEISSQGGNGGQIIKSSNTQKDITTTASENEKLPQTGAEHIILFVFALFLGTLVFYVRYRKKYL